MRCCCSVTSQDVLMKNEDASEDEQSIFGIKEQAYDEAEVVFTEKRLLSFYQHQLEENNGADKTQIPRQQQQHDTTTSPLHKPHSYPCSDTHRTLPSPPSSWPQRPIMWRPTPYTSSRIRGIRYDNASDYQHFDGFCAGCILPINSGREAPGNSMVVDFESNHFVGTILLRVRNVSSNNNRSATASSSRKDYFHGKKRTFQCVVRGKFKSSLRVSDCVTGQTFQRPAGKLPPRWMVASTIKLMSALAPQLEMSIDSQQPRFLTPMAATAQTVIVKKESQTEESESSTRHQSSLHSRHLTVEEQSKLNNIRVYPGASDMEAPLEEPLASDPTSLLQSLTPSQQHHASHSNHMSITRRQKTRKKVFNAVAAKHQREPCFDTQSEYTFEFYQHLLLFEGERLALDVGKVDLAPVLNGQPIQIMAAHRDPDTGALDTLWSFDLWHESLYELACAADAEE